MSSAARIIFYISAEDDMRFCDFCSLDFEMLRVKTIHFISFSMRAVYPDYVEGYNGGRISFRNSFCLSLAV